MTARNEITGDLLRTKTLSKEDQKKFDEGYDRIFGVKSNHPSPRYDDDATYKKAGFGLVQLELPLEEYPENLKDA